MNTTKMFGVLLGMGIATAACSAEPASSETESPDIFDDALSAQDEGTSWNGWSMSLSGWYSVGGFPLNQWYSSGTFSRSSGDLTRGGGTCAVYKRTVNPSSCTSDQACIDAAQAQFGSFAWGYCYQGACYDRVFAQSASCSTNPNRSPSSWNSPSQVLVVPANHQTLPGGLFSLGCMTKTAGPNTACGGTNTSLYMRSVTLIL
jgi:hypothetical protein